MEILIFVDKYKTLIRAALELWYRHQKTKSEQGEERFLVISAFKNSNETVQQDRTCIGLTSNSECNQPAFELFQQVQKGQTVESKSSWFFRPH